MTICGSRAQDATLSSDVFVVEDSVRESLFGVRSTVYLMVPEVHCGVA